MQGFGVTSYISWEFRTSNALGQQFGTGADFDL